MNQFGWNLANLCTYQCKAGGGLGGRQGMGWGFDCLCWPWGRAFNWSYSPIASPQPSFGVRSSRIHFSLTSTGEKWMREERTPKDVCGEASSPRGGVIWIFLCPMWGYLTADSNKRDWDGTCVSQFPRFTHAPYRRERSGNHGAQQEQVKGVWTSLFCLQILFILACFWSVEPFKIPWYQWK